MGNSMKSCIQRQMASVCSNDRAHQEPRCIKPEAELISATLDFFPVGPVLSLSEQLNQVGF